MKTNLHPIYYTDAIVRCNCGNEFRTGSTQKELKVETCSKCHPFYTGSRNLLDKTGGQVDKFKKRYNI